MGGQVKSKKRAIALKQFAIKPLGKKPLAESPLSVRVSSELDAIIRSLPDTTKWLREAIEKQAIEDGIYSDKNMELL